MHFITPFQRKLIRNYATFDTLNAYHLLILYFIYLKIGGLFLLLNHHMALLYIQ